MTNATDTTASILSGDIAVAVYWEDPHALEGVSIDWAAEFGEDLEQEARELAASWVARQHAEAVRDALLDRWPDLRVHIFRHSGDPDRNVMEAGRNVRFASSAEVEAALGIDLDAFASQAAGWPDDADVLAHVRRVLA